MKTSERGLDLIRQFEGCQLQSYLCPAGVWTIGYGHTVDVREGQEITQGHADDVLRNDVQSFEDAVGNLVAVPLTQGQFDALVSFTFNLGVGNLCASTLLRKLNAGDYQGAADQFPRWVRAKGIVLPGLVKRRAAERELFLSTSVPA